MNYYIKAYSLLIKRIIQGKEMPFHSKEMTVAEMINPANKQYLHNGVMRTAIAIARRKCRLHWLR